MRACVQVLFLPSMWHHRVAQYGSAADPVVIAVNYWYDMRFDARACYRELLAGLTAAL